MRRLTPVFFLFLVACGKGEEENLPPRLAVSTPTPTPAEYSSGEELFNGNCSTCHGLQAAGTQQGPPLVHMIYETNHHADASFYRAAQVGVRAHHWSFGHMAPVPTVTQDDVRQIISYVRWLQREAGIF